MKMSDKDHRSVESAPPASSAGNSPTDKREWASRVVAEMLQRMGVNPRLDIKDGGDGGISIAVQLDAEVPGVQAGKRSHVLDALQFLANKIVNRPGSERRWISIGVGGHPEPRVREARRAPDAQPAMAAPTSPAQRAPSKTANGRPAPPAPAKPLDEDETSVNPSEDAELSAAARKIAQRASSDGRFFAIVGMKRDDRARVLRAVQGVGGVKASAEGIGRNRRVVFTPDNPAPLPKGSLPMAEEDELEG
jgi:predicted RNA-binding protein Jag